VTLLLVTPDVKCFVYEAMANGLAAGDKRARLKKSS
jgi:hypothetical protein